jgi:hypothetical protein
MSTNQPLDFLRPEGPYAGPLAGYVADGRRSHLREKAKVKIFEFFVARDTYGDTHWTAKTRGYMVGIYSGGTSYLVLLAFNLGLGKDKQHRGYVILRAQSAGGMEQALHFAADAMAEAKSGEHPLVNAYPELADLLPARRGTKAA